MHARPVTFMKEESLKHSDDVAKTFPTRRLLFRKNMFRESTSAAPCGRGRPASTESSRARAPRPGCGYE